MSAGTKTKVAVLGGGIAGVTAALELTSTPDLRARYDVTIHQLGWRLGGKCASGRNAAVGDRIEEHGLHIWFGFYDNAFTLLRSCYDELGPDAKTPLPTFDAAFLACNTIVLGEEYEGDWLLHEFDVPSNGLVPGEPLPTLWQLVEDALKWARAEWDKLRSILHGIGWVPPERPGWPDLLRRAAEAIEEEIEDPAATAEAELFAMAEKIAHSLSADSGTARDVLLRALAEILRELKDAVWSAASHHMDLALLRRFAMMLDLFVTILVGLVDDDVIDKGFDSINDKELRAWLTEHGIHDYTNEHSPILRGWYSGGFAFEDGDPAKPNVAAGTAINAALRIFTYKGSILRKMLSGMGDTVLTPMYRVLQQRGVKVEFFHRVKHLGLADDHLSVATIEVVQQAQLSATEYQPLDPKNCWPNMPYWDQLENGHVIEETDINFEWGQDAPDATSKTLHVGEDFDIVVLAIPIAALPPICGELIDNKKKPKFKAMLDHGATTMTQASQIWTSKTAPKLGWGHPQDSVLTAYIEPIDTYSDMTDLLPQEHWPDKLGVANIAYFCGVLPDVPGETQQEATARALTNAKEFVATKLADVWPGSGSPEFDWDLLVDEEDQHGEQRFNSQYYRANFQPTERYSSSLAGSMKYRLAADESGYTNLILAGDWIRNGIDAGCVEATVMSGMQASRAICGVPATIVGEDHSWLEGSQ